MTERLSKRQMFNSPAVQETLKDKRNRDDHDHIYIGSFETKPIVRRRPGKFDMYVANMGHYKEIAFTSN